jgi:hypothetical protein
MPGRESAQALGGAGNLLLEGDVPQEDEDDHDHDDHDHPPRHERVPQAEGGESSTGSEGTPTGSEGTGGAGIGPTRTSGVSLATAGELGSEAGISADGTAFAGTSVFGSASGALGVGASSLLMESRTLGLGVYPRLARLEGGVGPRNDERIGGGGPPVRPLRRPTAGHPSAFAPYPN